MPYRLKNYRKVSSGMIYESYFKAANSDKINFELIEIGLPFGGSKEVVYKVFEAENGKNYAVRGFEHYNGHFSGFTDENSIISISIAEVIVI